MQAAIDRVLQTLSLRPSPAAPEPAPSAHEAASYAARLLDNYRRSLGARQATTH